MKRTLLSLMVFVCMAMSFGVSAAADNFKPSGVELQAVVSQLPQASALPDNSGAPAAVVTASQVKQVMERSASAIKEPRGIGYAVSASMRATSSSIKQVGNHANREAGARSELIRT